MSSKSLHWLLASLTLAGIGLALSMCERPAPNPRGAARGATSSNIYPADYVGPEVCGECHEDQYRGWSRGLHRRMNSLGDALVGDFSGVEIDYAGGRARFFTEGGDHYMEFGKAGAPMRRFVITRTIGSRYLQEYVGREVDREADREAGREADRAEEIRLPFGYWLRPRRWFHRQYYDSWYKAEYTADGQLSHDPYVPDDKPWAERCAWCHNTYPFDLRLIRSQTRMVGQGREQYFRLLHSPRSQSDWRSVADHNRLPIEDLVTVGISCESCHLGGRDHALGGRDISFVPRSDDIALWPDAPDLGAGRDSSVVVNTLCAQCHSTPSPRYPSGGVMRNSSEALDMASGGCMSQIACVDCHDPHAVGPGAGASVQDDHTRACAGCHPQIAAAGPAHTRHADVDCLDCHMPKIVKGVTEAVRTHRIARPVEPVMVEQLAPNACNLCHLDRSIRWTLQTLADWGAPVSLADDALARYGEKTRPVGAIWLEHGDHNTRAIAASAYSRSPLGQSALPRIIAILDDEIAFYRMWYLFAAEDILGRPIGPEEFEPTAPPGQRWRGQLLRTRTDR